MAARRGRGVASRRWIAGKDVLATFLSDPVNIWAQSRARRRQQATGWLEELRQVGGRAGGQCEGAREGGT